MVLPHTAGVPGLLPRLLRLGLSLASPRLVMIALIVLVAEWRFVPRSLPGSDGLATPVTLRPTRPGPLAPVSAVFLLRDGTDSWSVIDMSKSGDAIVPLVNEPPGRVLLASFYYERHVAGLWGPWVRHEASRVDLHPLFDGETPAADIAPARAAFAAWFNGRGSATYASLVLRGGQTSSRLIWWGPIVDLALLLSAIILLLGMIRLGLTLTHLRRRRALAAGLCPNCRYDLRGAAGSQQGRVICPECGCTPARTGAI